MDIFFVDVTVSVGGNAGTHPLPPGGEVISIHVVMQ
jgi:hypothetical protein